MADSNTGNYLIIKFILNKSRLSFRSVGMSSTLFSED